MIRQPPKKPRRTPCCTCCCSTTRVRSPAAKPFIKDHVAYRERHHRDGTFLVSGQTYPTSNGGAIVAHSVARSTIEQITAQDPFVANSAAKCTITTIIPGRVHPGLASVLKPAH
ncbi:YciI family protein [Streptomyces sp. NPDC101194]|uniref:YciI family protein n=1 Tax=Streptomyces sp. NPDC101194 TaxID=3366127 RepID=UPI0038284DAD